MKLRALGLAIVSVAVTLTPAFMTGFDGYDPEDFPVQIARPLVQPAGYAFSIWGLIYLWLILHAGFGLARRADVPAWDRPRLALMAAQLLGVVWVAFAEDQPVVATGVILVMAATALTAVLQTADGPRQGADRWLLQPPVALFAGWVTAASGVALGITLSGLGWLDDQTAALLMLAAVLIVAGVVQMRLRAPTYGAAVIWALAGIVMANRVENLTVTLAAAAGAAIMALIVWQSLRRA